MQCEDRPSTVLITTDLTLDRYAIQKQVVNQVIRVNLKPMRSLRRPAKGTKEVSFKMWKNLERIETIDFDSKDYVEG